MGFTAPEYEYAPPEKGVKPAGRRERSEVALVSLALNGNTIIFAALHFLRKPHKAFRLLDIGRIRYRW